MGVVIFYSGFLLWLWSILLGLELVMIPFSATIVFVYEHSYMNTTSCFHNGYK